MNLRFFCDSGHGTIIRTGKHVRKFLYKSLLNSVWLWSRARLAINKTQKYFSLPNHQLVENLILVLVWKKGQKKDKGEFVTESVGILVMIIFM